MWNLVRDSVLYGPTSKQLQDTWKSTRGGFEDDLEKGMRKLAKDEFGVELDENAFIG